MSREPRLQLPFDDWPAGDLRRWNAAFEPGDIFDDARSGADLADSTRGALRVSYGQFLRFVSIQDQDLLARSPGARIDRNIVTNYVAWLRRSQGDSSIAISLHHLRLALRLICPENDWSWLLTITKRIAAAAQHKPKKYNLVTSERLYLLGNQLMDSAAAAVSAARRTSKEHALQYRDGLLIAFLSLVPLRRRTLTALRIGRHLVKVGDLWTLEIPAADTKVKVALGYAIGRNLSKRIDTYLEKYRCRLPGADKHNGLWASNKGFPMLSAAIYDAVRHRTKAGLGFAVNLHRFRHAAASLWSMHDPVNVRGAKDLLGQFSFSTTEKFYIMGQSRVAGRALAHAIDKCRFDLRLIT